MDDRLIGNRWSTAADVVAIYMHVRRDFNARKKDCASPAELRQGSKLRVTSSPGFYAKSPYYSDIIEYFNGVAIPASVARECKNHTTKAHASNTTLEHKISDKTNDI